MTLPPDTLSGFDPLLCGAFALIVVATIVWAALEAIARAFRGRR